MKFLRESAKRLCRIVLTLKALSEVPDLCGGGNTASKLLANALRETLANNITPEESIWIEEVESLRKELSSSTTEIMIVDHGAASANLDLTDTEMYQGRAVTRTIGEVCNASKPYFWSLLLFKLVREFRPSVCLELGTSLGISASYQAAALKLNHVGQIVTLEGAESLVALARKHFQTLGLDNVTVVAGRFQDTLDNVLNEYGPIDCAFIDGHHDEKATLAYFEMILPFLSGKAVLVFDDIAWSKGMKRAWGAIKTHERVEISVDLTEMGICVCNPGNQNADHSST